MNTPKLKKFLIGGGIIIALILIISGCKFFKNSSNESSVSTATNTTNTAEIPGLPPDPGEAGKATLAGIITNSEGVRDDIYRYIMINYQDSAKTRAVLFQKARVWQNVLLDAGDKAKSMRHAEDFLSANACLRYIHPQDSSILIDSLKSVFINTDTRYKAYRTFDQQIGDQMFNVAASLDERKSACAFDPDSLPN